ncbi:cytochrome D1 domain-containing protein [Candidatus Accumulibacter phosphatis]|uniref:Protein nirF n=2 Tax=Candidatus Accumulibacter TaxID=327159 RepID=A0A7D5NEA6_9PROT|nr:cytochrome D1 domain-containing protein [Candidatus Accumulibacter phosphatis]QLH50848.1 MAG: protein nirF [Candidatus Accumulibacter cognatus]TMQ75408.1 Heme d1 biosynthesis protein NirF [Candidatus Accumulibacter phosphatis]
MKRLWTLLSMVLLAGCTTPTLRGSADLGVVIERASGQLSLVDTSRREVYARIGGLGDLSHASVVFARDGRYAYVFGRDGGLSKVDLLEARIVKRVLQSGNAIGGAISQDGRIVVAQNYTPGGIKAFDAETLELLSEVPAEYAPGNFSKVVGLADLAGQRFAYALFDGGEVWISDFSDPRQPQTQRYPAGLQPYDGLVTPDGRHYLAGLFGEDGVALLDTWRSEQGTRRILGNYGRGEEKLPVFKMPHLRGWSMAQGNAYLPAIGRHEVMVVAGSNWQEIAHIAVKGQPVFVMARPDGRQVWVNYAFPDNGWVEVIDTLSGKIVKTLAPGRAILHMEFTPRGEQVWISARDDNRVLIYDTATFTKLGELEVQAPSGIFFTSRANRMGF